MSKVVYGQMFVYRLLFGNGALWTTSRHHHFVMIYFQAHLVLTIQMLLWIFQNHVAPMSITSVIMMMFTGSILVATEKKRKRNVDLTVVTHGGLTTVKMMIFITAEPVMLRGVLETVAIAILILKKKK